MALFPASHRYVQGQIDKVFGDLWNTAEDQQRLSSLFRDFESVAEGSRMSRRDVRQFFQRERAAFKDKYPEVFSQMYRSDLYTPTGPGYTGDQIIKDLPLMSGKETDSSYVRRLKEYKQKIADGTYSTNDIVKKTFSDYTDERIKHFEKPQIEAAPPPRTGSFYSDGPNMNGTLLDTIERDGVVLPEKPVPEAPNPGPEAPSSNAGPGSGAPAGRARAAMDKKRVQGAFEYGDATGYYAMRRKLGRQYDAIAHDFNDAVKESMADFRRDNPTGDYMEALKSPNSKQANELFEIKRKLSEGMYEGESRLNAAHQDLYDQKGRGALFGMKGSRGTEAMAARHASDDMIRTTDTFDEFFSLLNDDGSITQYRRGNRVVEGVTSGENSRNTLLQSRTIKDGEMGKWGNSAKADSDKLTEAIKNKSNRLATVTDSTSAETLKSMTSDLTEHGAFVASDAQGATNFNVTRRTIDDLDDSIRRAAAQNNHLPGGNYRARAAASSDYVDARVASKIANTATGETSGIFSQLADAAAAHPVIAAGIAIGGFALASKALDRRREYD